MRLQTLLVALLVTLSACGAAAPSEKDRATLSDVMARLQVQHAKLWFAGKLSNWGLANYEIQQIDRSLGMIGKLLTDPSQSDRARVQLQSIGKAIQEKDVPTFMKAYAALTNECNSCHRASGYASITIQIPVNPPVSNQLFADQLAQGRGLAYASCGTCHILPDAKTAPTSRPPAPSLLEIVNRPSFSADALREFLASNHRRLGNDFAMPNPRLAEYQIEAIAAFLETLRAGRAN